MSEKKPEPSVSAGMQLTHLWVQNPPDPNKLKKEALKARMSFAAKLLRSGEPLDPKTRDAIAELLEQVAQGRGRPPKGPMKWWEVGQLIENRPDLTQQQAAKMLNITERTLQNGLNYYRKARQAHDEALKDEI